MPDQALEDLSIMYLCLNGNNALPGVGFRGLKGAALAAFGEIPGVFAVPLTASDAGVKLGESTLNFFLTKASECKLRNPNLFRRLELHTFLVEFGRAWA